ncbi:cytochrome P450 51 [Calocera viscosa TUFC12733]|uniref:Cytochrome P450 51 n=1 Tax=Calocera viscosa (strain TUFC12733) TaxID=1330018 RepID=A0A167R2Z5_CALVF|nr:cytochrome P450 51 [Calocera viscosa TUFC12733]
MPGLIDSLFGILAGVHWLSLGVVLFLAVPALAIVWNVVKQLPFLRDANRPPVVFHILPFIGSTVSYGMDPYKFFFAMREKYGDVFTFVLLGRRVTVALGTKGNNMIMGGKLSQVNAEEAYTNLTTPVFGEDVVFDVPNHVLMEQKRFVKFGLTTENFRAYVGMIEEEVEMFLNTDSSFSAYNASDNDVWGSFDAYHSMAQLTILTASRTLQGKEVRSQMKKSFAQMYEDLDGGFTPLNMIAPNIPLPNNLRRNKARKAMTDFYLNILRQRREKPSEETDYDMLAALKDQRYKDGRPVSDKEIAHMMIALLMAGQHTSSATVSWCLLHIAHRQDIQQALYEEQVEHFSNGDGSLRSPTYEELKGLPILDSIIRETLRLHPPLHSLMRKVVSDMPVPYSLGNASEDRTLVIPKGNYVLAAPCISQVDPGIWRKPLEWDPSRWTEAGSLAAQLYRDYTETGEKVDYGFGMISKGTDSPYQPFGSGRHRCIGEQFAYVQLETILAMLVRKLELKIDHVPPHNYTTMIISPQKPRNIEFRRRQVSL